MHIRIYSSVIFAINCYNLKCKRLSILNIRITVSTFYFIVLQKINTEHDNIVGSLTYIQTVYIAITH